MVNLTRAIAVSCNVYFYDLGYRTGIDGLNKYTALYGLGQPTGGGLVSSGGYGPAGYSGMEIRELQDVGPWQTRTVATG